MRRVIAFAAACGALLAPAVALAQQAPPTPNPLSPRLWIVAGTGFAAALTSARRQPSTFDTNPRRGAPSLG